MIAHYFSAELSGLQFDIKLNKGVLVNEAKIPYRNNPAYTFSLTAESGDMIASGFEIEKIELDRSPQKREADIFLAQIWLR